MKLHKHIALFLLLWIVCIIIWVSTFLIDPLDFTEKDSIIPFLLLVRCILVGAGVLSFFSAMALAIKNQHISEVRLHDIQLVSIFAGITSVILGLSNIDQGGVIILSGLVSLCGLFVSIVALRQRKKVNILLFINLIVCLYPAFWIFLLIFLAGIGFGPPS